MSDYDPANIDKDDRLYIIRYLLDKLKENCKENFFPFQNIFVDERMVKNKGQFACKQYVRIKPVKWGFKLWYLLTLKWDIPYFIDQSPRRLIISFCRASIKKYCHTITFITSYKFVPSFILICS